MRNAEYHNRRMNHARHELFGCTDTIDIERRFDLSHCRKDLVYKLRIIYKKNIMNGRFIIYKPRTVQTLRLVACNNLNYYYKYLDRQSLEDIFGKRAGCDDILIVKNGFITDTSYSNIIFHDGKKWFTPSNPLLNGTKRQLLLDSGEIEEDAIRPADLHLFSNAKLINAMLEIEDPGFIPIENIVF